MSIKSDFLRLAGLPTPVETETLNENVLHKDKAALSAIKPLIIKTIKSLDKEQSNTSSPGLKKLYHQDMLGYDYLLDLFVSGNHKAAVKAWANFDTGARDHIFDNATEDEKHLLQQYFGVLPITAAVPKPDEEIIKQGQEMQHAKDLEDFDKVHELDEYVIKEVETDPIHGKAPRKGTVAYDIWKTRVQSDKQGKNIKIKDERVGVAKIVKESIEVIDSVEQGIEDKADEIEKNTTEEEKVKVPADVFTAIKNSIKELEDRFNNKYITHLPNIQPELQRYAETIEILKSMEEVFKSGCPYNINKMSTLMLSLDGAMKPMIPEEVWKFLSLSPLYHKSMIKSLNDLFKEVKVQSS
jgi:hypothetical protein